MPHISWEIGQKEHEWAQANVFFETATEEQKFRRYHEAESETLPEDISQQHDQPCLHSFIKIKDTVYAIATKTDDQRELGKGSYGRVKFLEDAEGNIYAAKIMTPKKSNTFKRKELNNLQTEAKRLEDLGLSRGSTMITDNRGRQKFIILMDYLGEPLPSPSSLNDEEKKSTALNMIAAVRDLHDGSKSKRGQPLIHCDLKECQFLQKDGTIHLIDVGLAKDAGTSYLGVQEKGQPVGSPIYAAPELTSVNGSYHSFQSDIYSMGVIFDRKNPAIIEISPAFTHFYDTNFSTEPAFLKGTSCEWLAEMMRCISPEGRPSLALVQMALLVDMYPNQAQDQELLRLAREYRCAETTNAHFIRETVEQLRSVYDDLKSNHYLDENPRVHIPKDQYDEIVRLNRTLYFSTASQDKINKELSSLMVRVFSNYTDRMSNALTQGQRAKLWKWQEQMLECSTFEALCNTLKTQSNLPLIFSQNRATTSMQCVIDLLNTEDFPHLTQLVLSHQDGTKKKKEKEQVSMADINSYLDRQSSPTERFSCLDAHLLYSPSVREHRPNQAEMQPDG